MARRTNVTDQRRSRCALDLKTTRRKGCENTLSRHSLSNRLELATTSATAARTSHTISLGESVWWGSVSRESARWELSAPKSTPIQIATARRPRPLNSDIELERHIMTYEPPNKNYKSPHKRLSKANKKPVTLLKMTLEAILDLVLITAIAGFLIFCLALQEVKQDWNQQTWIFVGLLGIMLLQFIRRGIHHARRIRKFMSESTEPKQSLTRKSVRR